MAEEVEVGAAVHLAFQELQARDLALASGVAPPQFEGGRDGGVVGADNDLPKQLVASLGEPPLKQAQAVVQASW